MQKVLSNTALIALCALLAGCSSPDSGSGSATTSTSQSTNTSSGSTAGTTQGIDTSSGANGGTGTGSTLGSTTSDGHLIPSPWSSNRTGGPDGSQTTGSGFGQNTYSPPSNSGGDSDYKQGMSYRQKGGEINDREAAKCFLAAAKQGNAAAMYELGYMYERGSGVSQEYRSAAAMYKHAADAGNADAQAKMNDQMYRELIARPDTADVDPLRH